MIKSPRAFCDECGGECYFDAFVDYQGNVKDVFETAYCPYCEDEIKYRYTVSED